MSRPAPIVLTQDELPTDVDLAMVDYGLGCLLRCHLLLEEAREREQRTYPTVRASFERKWDREVLGG